MGKQSNYYSSANIYGTIGIHGAAHNVGTTMSLWYSNVIMDSNYVGTATMMGKPYDIGKQ